MGKKTLGRQKIEMVKVKNENHLQVTFSKRRKGLFNKASELSILCGAQVALIVFSPGARVYSFGHPSVGAVIERYLMNAPASPVVVNAVEHDIESESAARIRRLHEELSALDERLEQEKKRTEALAELGRKSEEAGEDPWWKAPIDELDRAQLLELMNALEVLKEKVDQGPGEGELSLQLALPSVPAVANNSLQVQDIDLNRNDDDDASGESAGGGGGQDIAAAAAEDDGGEPSTYVHKFI